MTLSSSCSVALLLSALALAAAPAMSQSGAQKSAAQAPAASGVEKAASEAPDLAYGAYQRGLYFTAFTEATKRIEADASDAAAMTLLGELYNQGLGVRQDPVEAARWYRLAAERGMRTRWPPSA